MAVAVDCFLVVILGLTNFLLLNRVALCSETGMYQCLYTCLRNGELHIHDAAAARPLLHVEDHLEVGP